MDTASFLRLILADTGYICIGIKLEKGYSHRFFSTPEEAAAYALAEDARGMFVYHACATFISPANRKQVNVAYLKCLYCDVDVGDDKPYQTRAQAEDAMIAFLKASGMPPPTIIVHSGERGMHLYWVLDAPITKDIWKPYAVALRELMKKHGFAIDVSRSADSSSVLRPPGTHNRKRGRSDLVQVVHASPPLRLADLPLKTQVDVERQRVRPQGLSKHAIGYSDSPSDANKVADGCPQIGNFRDKKGNVPYYEWLYAIWTLKHTTQGEPICHEWSVDHLTYSFEETQRKLDEDSGPITCKRFHEHAPERCEACQWWGKISTPLQLGRDVGRQQSNLVSLPLPTINGHASAPSFINTDGLYFVTETKSGETEHKLVSSRPLRLTSVCRGERNPDFSLIFEMDMPHAGTLPISIGSGVFFSSQGMPELHRLGAVIHDNDLMRKYVRESIDNFNTDHPPDTRFEQMGWKNHDNAFLVGNKLYTQEKEVICAGSPEVERRARLLGPRGGSLAAWSAAANQLFAVGCEPHSFALCCAFGATLMRFHSEEGGAIINLVSEQSATGKTTALAAVASVWGELDGVRLTDDDTRVSRGLLLGVLGNLPCVFDELHRRDPDAIRQFCITFTNGRDKLRGRADGSLISPAGDWQTILILGSNQSLVDILQSKGHEEAQAFRILEFPCEQNFAGTEGDKLRRTLRENAGHAGQAFIKWLMQPRALEFARRELDTAVKEIWEHPDYGFQREHRFWVRAIACAFVAGNIANHMGLIDAKASRVCRWAIDRCIERRKGEFKKEAAQTLNEALYEIWAMTLVVDVEWKAKNMCQILASPNPNKGFHARRVHESGKMYVSRTWLYKWLSEHGINKTAFMKELVAEHVILNQNKFCTLGAGTSTMHGGGQIMCVEINMKHPKMKESLDVSELDVAAEARKVLAFRPKQEAAPSPPASSQ